MRSGRDLPRHEGGKPAAGQRRPGIGRCERGQLPPARASCHLDLVPAAAGDRFRAAAAEDEGEVAGVAVIESGVCLLETVEPDHQVNGCP